MLLLLDQGLGQLTLYAVFYTGNGTVAKIISAAAAKHLTPCVLELGGKNPIVVDPNYPDVDLAAKRIIYGKCSNAGQVRKNILIYFYHQSLTHACVPKRSAFLRTTFYSQRA